ncbi:type II toxin-antitoxin system PemK/MazF family toxin [uncultured Jannaschia sp.]|uniref:type II toxin-antitoxin system PemK/MazF family toxin n=1 Tax=uncultured Jannaschia sp. TaxID=293347 RepID=UPI00262F4699|nr:type II toxin-antitoxin system PemK/MazF family toxin [uncultured Jannaschia sp.]
MCKTKKTSCWRKTLSAGDIVSFAFPSSERLAEMEKARPSLVLAVDRQDDETMVTVAYGTSSRTRSNTGFELHVRTPEDVAAAGLHKPTRFIGARTVTVPLPSSRFVECAGGTVVLGRVPPQLRLRLEQVARLASQSGSASRRRGCRTPHGRRHRSPPRPERTDPRSAG